MAAGTCLLVACVLSGCTAVRDSQPEVMRDPQEIADRLAEREMAGAVLLWRPLSEEPEIPHAERVVIQQPDGRAGDRPRYFLHKELEADEFWVLEIGGPLADEQWYGPLEMRLDGQVVNVPPR